MLALAHAALRAGFEEILTGLLFLLFVLGPVLKRLFDGLKEKAEQQAGGPQRRPSQCSVIVTTGK